MNSFIRLSARLVSLAMLAMLMPAVAAQVVPDNKAMLIVRVPAGAIVHIGDVATQQTGPQRTFLSPPLTPGKNYSYVLKATWTEAGQPKTATKEVSVQAGQRVEVDLTTGAVPALNKKDPPPRPVEPKPVDVGTKPQAAKARTFLFTYAVTLKDLPPDKTARVWLPVAVSNEHQEVEIVDTKSLPDGFKIDKEPGYGNSILYAEVKGDKEGNANLAITYKVTRHEVRGSSPADVPDAAKIPRYLEGDKFGPLQGKHLDLIKDKKLPADQTGAAKTLYDVVNHHMKYSKDVPGWGKGDVIWACDSKTGNCTDFHGLFIALARANKIPAKFEMGFPLPAKRGEGEVGGYHCWAYFKPEGKGWVPVDISEANKDPKMTDYYFGNLTEDRVAFTTGRDYELVPKQEGETRNYLIYPYVEVDGKEYTKVGRKFTYKDLPH